MESVTECNKNSITESNVFQVNTLKNNDGQNFALIVLNPLISHCHYNVYSIANDGEAKSSTLVTGNTNNAFVFPLVRGDRYFVLIYVLDKNNKSYEFHVLLPFKRAVVKKKSSPET